MTYPIFHSVVNRIEADLSRRDISIKTFRTWNEDRINATGLEIVIDLSPKTNHLNALSINFDWDRFRETVLAQQLEGMEEHPFLQEENMVSTSISPLIDIEVTWQYNVEPSKSYAQIRGNLGQLEASSQWMEKISSKVNDLLAEDDIITRWHVEIEGDEKGKYLSAANLISYFQYTLVDLNSLNEVHKFVGDKLEKLLLKSQKVMTVSDQTLEEMAA